MEAAKLPCWADAALLALRWLARENASPAAAPDLQLDAASVEELRRRRVDSLYYWATNDVDSIQAIYDRVSHQQTIELLDLVADFRAAGLELAVFKGAALARRIRKGLAIHSSGDLDVLVPRASIEEAKCLLYSRGYRQGFFDPEVRSLKRRDFQEIASLEAQHYELVAFNRQVPFLISASDACHSQCFSKLPLWIYPEEAVLVLEVDIHHGVAIDVDCEKLLARAVEYDGFPTFCDADHLWFGLARYYNEVAIHGKRSLRDIAYLAPLPKFGNVDWDVFSRQVRETSTQPAIFYMLQFLDRLSGGAVPREVLRDIEPGGESRYRDWGTLLPQLFGLKDSVPLALLDRLAS